MPKRTNEFQQLVSILKSHAAEGATVQESELLTDRLTGDEREVDITVSALVGGHLVRVSLECRDHKRTADVTWIEQMKAKHERLPTHSLVLVSRAGFTKSATRTAAKYGIEILAFENVETSRIANLIGPASSLWAKTWELSPRKIHITVPAQGGQPSETFAALPDNDIYDAGGKITGTVRSLVEEMLHADPVIKEMAHEGDQSHTHFEVSAEPPQTKSGERLYVMKVAPRLLRPIDHIVVRGGCAFAVSEFRLKQGQLGDIHVAWGSGQLKGDNHLLVLSDASGVARLTITKTVVPKN